MLGESSPIRTYVGIMMPPSVYSVMASTPSLASESGMTLIMSKESSDVNAVYASGTVSTTATTTIALACLMENLPACEKYLLPMSTILPYTPPRISLPCL